MVGVDVFPTDLVPFSGDMLVFGGVLDLSSLQEAPK